jgi:hypothetical protein
MATHVLAKKYEQLSNFYADACVRLFREGNQHVKRRNEWQADWSFEE